MNNAKRSSIGLAAASIFVLITAAYGTDKGRLTGMVETGFDSFAEKYSIVERDTIDDVTEFQTRLGLAYLRGNRFRDYFHLEGRAVGGNNVYEGEARLRLASSTGSYRYGADMQGTVRRFRDNSTYTFPNNYERYQLRAFFQKRLSPSLSVRLNERLERMDFEKITEFDYDYWLNSLSVSGDIEPSLTSQLHAAVGYEYKAIPDTTEIGYRAVGALIDFRNYPGLYRQIGFSLAAERRTYNHEPVRSPFWEISAEMALAPFAWGPWGFKAENYFESYIYDENSEVYFTYLENKSALLLTYHRSLDLQLMAGPSIAYFSSNDSEVDEYSESGARLAVEYARGIKMWLSCTYERGWRSYYAYVQDDPESIFSDYTFDRLTLFITARIWSRIGINGFFNHEPERHKREGDDSTITLFSLSLSYAF